MLALGRRAAEGLPFGPWLAAAIWITLTLRPPPFP
jgi:prepilin signal peptidase PulO-like enzyme (type II secretory pathway)